ncbi:MAG: hypothetical protein FD129_1134 [bacterium]|nr:MAG: hypothetical protein FD129_1134 [bacterium]
MDRAALVRRLLLVVSALGLAAVWAGAAFLKSLDPAAFADQITKHHLTPEAWSLGLAYLFVGIGCFGRLAARHPREVILEDLGFVLMAGVGFWAAAGSAGFRWSGRVFLLLLPLALALPFVGPHLPFDSLVTTFNPGEDMTDLAAEDLPQGLDEGRVLLVLVGGNCAACDAGLESLNAIAATEGGPTVIAVYAGSRAEARSWALDHVPGFAVGSAPEKVLRQYYRKLPQVGLLSEGKLVQVWRGVVPAPGDVTALPDGVIPR